MLALAANPSDAPTLAEPLGRSVRVADAAIMLACDQSTVRKMVRAGHLTAHRVGVAGRGIRVTVASIEAYKVRTTVGATPVTRPTAPAPAPTAAYRAALANLRDLGLL
jgi:excisionase family DNA binding protein